MKNTVKRLTTIFFIIGLVMMVSGVALAVFTYNADSSQIYAIEGGSVRIQFNDYNVGYFTEKVGMPMTLNEAVNTIDPKTFTITTVNNSDKYIVVYINMDLNTTGQLKKSMLNYALYRDGECIAESTTVPQSGQIAIERIAPNKNQTSEQIYNYELYVWVDYRVTVSSQAQDNRSLYFVSNQVYSGMSFNYTLNVDAKDTGYINYHCKEGSIYCPPPTILDEKTTHISSASPHYVDYNYENTFIGYATSQEKADRGEVEYYPGDPIPPVSDLYAAYTCGVYHMGDITVPSATLNTITKVVYKYIKEADFEKEADYPTTTYSQKSTKAGTITLQGSAPAKPVFCWVQGTTLYIGAEGQIAGWKMIKPSSNSDNNITEVEISNFDPYWMGTSYSVFEGCKFKNIDLEFFAYGEINFSMFQSNDNLEIVDFSKCDQLRLASLQLAFSGCNSLTKVIFPKYKLEGCTSLYLTFNGCFSLQELDLSMLDFSTITNMYSAFYYALNLRTIYVGKYFDISKCSNFADLFARCDVLQGGAGHFAIDLNPDLINPVTGLGSTGSWSEDLFELYFRPDTAQSPGVLTYKEL